MTAPRSKRPHKRSRTDIRIRSGRKKPPFGDSGGQPPAAVRTAEGRCPPRIGVISDTHGLIRPEAIAALQGVDAILHAGDVGGDHVLEALRAIAPVTFVRGNVDDGSGESIVRVNIDGIRILLTHILPKPHELRESVRRSIRSNPADIVVFGHSHQPHNGVIDGVLFFNPGSAGPRRFKLPVAVGIIERDRAYHIELTGLRT